PDEAPSMVAMKRVGELFDEGSSDSQVMIVLEGEEPLGADARAFYDELVKRLEADDAHVENVQDLWSDPLTATGVQSPDGKSAYVQVKLAGNQGEALTYVMIGTMLPFVYLFVMADPQDVLPNSSDTYNTYVDVCKHNIISP